MKRWIGLTFRLQVELRFMISQKQEDEEVPEALCNNVVVRFTAALPVSGH